MSLQAVSIPKELKRIDSLRWVGWLAFDWVLIMLAMAGAIHARHWMAWVAAIVVIGNLQHALGILGHDAAHYLAFRNRLVNDLVANCFISWPIAWSVDGYRAWHMKHHRHTGTQKDPELAMKRMSAPAWDLPLTPRKVLVEVLLDLCGRGFPGLAAGFLLFPPPKGWRRVGPVLFPLLVSGALIAMGLWQAVALWYLSFGTTFTAFMRLRMFIEHAGTDGTHRVKLSRLEALVLAPHNTWYHWEHHHYPFVPCFLLPEIRRLDTSVPSMSTSELWKALIRSAPLPSGEVPDRASCEHRKALSRPGLTVTRGQR